MRIQSVVLEYHGDITVLRLDVVHQLAVDTELTVGDIFQTCDHTKSGGLTTSGWSYENDKLFICDLQIEISYSMVTVWIYLLNILQR